MYKVVLIDDEYIIVEGLRRVVKWADYGCQVAGTAEDGAQGAELIRREKPDILFTDICMPGTDGLTMLAALRSEFPDMQVTVLSGYSDFSYAKEAIRLGVTRYLLKPSKMDEINEALAAMTAKLKPQPQAETEATEEAQAGSFIVRRAMAFMEKHFAEKLTLQDVADHCYVSPWHLSKLLNRDSGKSFYDILNTLRIAEAKKLLANPQCRIGDISEAVGYVDTAHFSRVFKKLEGISANEYRNRMK